MTKRLNKEIKHAHASPPFPNEAALLHLASDALMEQSEEWETGKSYLKLGIECTRPERMLLYPLRLDVNKPYCYIPRPHGMLFEVGCYCSKLGTVT